MALWRFGRSWPEQTMKAYLAELADRPVSFDTDPTEMVEAKGWTVDGEEARIGTEPPGPPERDGVFARARQGIINYDFSDPDIVEGHFDPNRPLLGRDFLLEIKIWGLHYLNGARINAVREETCETQSLFGFRYDTLAGHIERGYEWFLLMKDHETGEVRFRIEAHWQLGDFPNWWSHLGFSLVGERFRKTWRDRAPIRLRRLATQDVEKPVAAPGHLAHRGDPQPKRSRSAR